MVAISQIIFSVLIIIPLIIAGFINLKSASDVSKITPTDDDLKRIAQLLRWAAILHFIAVALVIIIILVGFFIKPDDIFCERLPLIYWVEPVLSMLIGIMVIVAMILDFVASSRLGANTTFQKITDKTALSSINLAFMTDTLGLILLIMSSSFVIGRMPAVIRPKERCPGAKIEMKTFGETF